VALPTQSEVRVPKNRVHGLIVYAVYSNFSSSNKFRDIMKRFDAGIAAEGGNGVATTKLVKKRVKSAATKKGPAAPETRGEDREEESEEDEPPKKKAE
jgi:hypothetical protein